MPTTRYYAVKNAIVATGQTTISQNASLGAGRDYHLPVGNIASGGVATGNAVRSLIQFDIDFSVMSTISAATLYLTTARADDGIVAGYQRSTHSSTWSSSGSFQVQQITEGSWNGGVRGNDEIWYTDNAVVWDTQPDNDLNSITTIQEYSSRPSTPSLAITGILEAVENWRNGQPNYGLLLRASNETGTGFQEYYSIHAQSDGLIADAVGPYLEITYTSSSTPRYVTAYAVNPKDLGIAKIANLSDETEWTSTSSFAAPYLDWRILLGTRSVSLTSWRMEMWDGESSSGTLVFDSGTITQSPYLGLTDLTMSYENPAWMPGGGWQTSARGLANGSPYTYRITAVDAAGSAGTMSQTTFKVRWSQALYEFDLGAGWSQTSLWKVTNNAPGANTSIALLYRTLTQTGGRNARATIAKATGNSSAMTYFLNSKLSFITGVNSADGTFITYAGTNTFSVGDYISVSGISTSDQYNVSNVSVTGASGTTFTVAAAATGTFSHTGNNRPYAFSAQQFSSGQLINVSGVNVSAGTNTYNISKQPIAAAAVQQSGTITNVTASSGTVRYTASNAYSQGDVVTVYGVNPVGYNIENAVITAATATYFEVESAATGTYVSSAGRGQSLIATVNTPGSATYSSGGTVDVAWTSSVSPWVATARYLNTAVRLSSDNGFTSPELTALSLEYANSALSADNWFDIGGVSFLDSSMKRFGTKSLRFTGNATDLITESYAIDGASGDGTVITYVSNHNYSIGNTITTTGISPSGYNLSGVAITSITTTTFTVAGTETGTFSGAGVVTRSQYDSYVAAGDAYSDTPDIQVVPNTNYTYSVYVKPNILYGSNHLRARIYAGGNSLGNVIADSGPHTSFPVDNEGWYRMFVTFNSGSGRTSVRPTIYLVNNSNVNGNSFWSDGAQFEEGSVVRSWTPGFVTSGITFEGGGLKIDKSGGASLRLRGSDLTDTRSVTELGEKGLLFGGDVSPVHVYSGTASTLSIGGSADVSGRLTVAGNASFTGGSVDFGADSNIYRASANTLRSDDVFLPKNMALGTGAFAGTLTSGTGIVNVTGLSVISSAGTAATDANFFVFGSLFKGDPITGSTASYVIASGAQVISGGTLTQVAIYYAFSSLSRTGGLGWRYLILGG